MFKALQLNSEWHSRLPEFKYPPEKCLSIGAEFNGVYYAAAIWSPPSARMLNNRGMYELRRLAISPDSPKNTASRMLRIMRLLICKKRPDVTTLISYQDTEVHSGAIYKAAGWKQGATNSVGATGWNTRSPNKMQSTSKKIRWELHL